MVNTLLQKWIDTWTGAERTRADLARRLGCHRSQISRWCSGSLEPNITSDIWKKAVTELNPPAEELDELYTLLGLPRATRSAPDQQAAA